MTDTPTFNSHDDLTPFLQLRATGPQAWESGRIDDNLNGRVFGGQLLAHAVTAALDDAGGRHLSSLRFGFLQGALAGTPVNWAAQTLQQGSRYTTRHLRATQGERVIADAHATLQVSAQGYEHADAMPTGMPDPESLPTQRDLEQLILARTGETYSLQRRAYLDLRLIDAERYLLQPAPDARLRYWLRVSHRLPDDPAVHSAALAFLSDFWLNYAALAPHIAVTGARSQIYVASLNHSLWQYADCRADEWLFFDVESPCGHDGRGLAWGRIYTRSGQLVACAAQEMVSSARAAGR